MVSGPKKAVEADAYYELLVTDAQEELANAGDMRVNVLTRSSAREVSQLMDANSDNCATEQVTRLEVTLMALVESHQQQNQVLERVADALEAIVNRL